MVASSGWARSSYRGYLRGIRLGDGDIELAPDRDMIRRLGLAAFGPVDADTGQPIGGGKAIGRYLSYIVSGLFCSLGFLWAFWDVRRQAWHDKIVNTVVVKA